MPSTDERPTLKFIRTHQGELWALYQDSDGSREFWPGDHEGPEQFYGRVMRDVLTEDGTALVSEFTEPTGGARPGRGVRRSA